MPVPNLISFFFKEAISSDPEVVGDLGAWEPKVEGSLIDAQDMYVRGSIFLIIQDSAAEEQ